ncbi:transaldolase [Pontibacterium sp.]|uniref:transaldolase n=1 Tax=Pontibacterium sp. TaxID=2036026 RepID=UPI003518EB31
MKKITPVVADTGDIQAIRTFKPVDATTNPSLLLKAAGLADYAPLLTEAKSWAQEQGGDNQALLGNMTDRFAVSIGREILNIIPGRISTEVDARLSFDTQATVERAHKLIRMYDEAGLSKERMLIKIASTGDGIEAARQLEKEGINCNLTLLFNFAQAAACAEAGAYLISPFVGRILDWYKANTEAQDYTGLNDPGVQSVSRIYNYFKTNNYNTIVMGASFRNIGEIQALSGCDRLTIAPALMQELSETNATLTQQLSASQANSKDMKVVLDEASFRWELNEDPMATEKLAQGIRAFAVDQVKLETLLSQQ